MMKNINLAFILFFVLFSCQDVIDVDLDTQEPKLVVEASMLHYEDSFQTQFIKLSMTTGYFSPDIPTVDGANISIKNLSTQQTYLFDDTNESGYYSKEIPMEIGQELELNIELNGEVYQARETLLETPEVYKIEQLVFENPFLDDAIEIKAHFKDNPNEKNYYLVQWIKNQNRFDYYITDDEFFNENMSTSVYMQRGTEKNNQYQPGDTVTVIISSISSTMYDYLNKLLEVSGNAGNPFASPMGPVRGNIRNTTFPANYPLGYFSLTHIQTNEIIIE